MSTTADIISVEVPDIGDFDDVPVIEILVAPGDTVALDDPMLTLESDKATMDVPAPFSGVVQEVRVKVGDRVSQGTLLLTMSPAEGTESSARASAIASDGAPTEATAPDAVGGALAAEPPSLPLLHRLRLTGRSRSTPARRRGDWPANGDSIYRL